MVLDATIALFCWVSQEGSLQACTARRSVPFHSKPGTTAKRDSQRGLMSPAELCESVKIPEELGELLPFLC